PRPEVHVRRRSLGEIASLVERAEQLLRGAAELRQPDAIEPLRRVAERRRWAIAGARDRHRRNAAAHERGLLVEAEGEREVEQLAKRARPRGPRPGLVGDPECGGLD